MFYENGTVNSEWLFHTQVIFCDIMFKDCTNKYSISGVVYNGMHDGILMEDHNDPINKVWTEKVTNVDGSVCVLKTTETGTTEHVYYDNEKRIECAIESDLKYREDKEKYICKYRKIHHYNKRGKLVREIFSVPCCNDKGHCVVAYTKTMPDGSPNITQCCMCRKWTARTPSDYAYRIKTDDPNEFKLDPSKYYLAENNRIIFYDPVERKMYNNGLSLRPSKNDIDQYR